MRRVAKMRAQLLRMHDQLRKVHARMKETSIPAGKGTDAAAALELMDRSACALSDACEELAKVLR